MQFLDQFYSKKNFNTQAFNADISECKHRNLSFVAMQTLEPKGRLQVDDAMVRECMTTKGYTVDRNQVIARPSPLQIKRPSPQVPGLSFSYASVRRPEASLTSVFRPNTQPGVNGRAALAQGTRARSCVTGALASDIGFSFDNAGDARSCLKRQETTKRPFVANSMPSAQSNPTAEVTSLGFVVIAK